MAKILTVFALLALATTSAQAECWRELRYNGLFFWQMVCSPRVVYVYPQREREIVIIRER